MTAQPMWGAARAAALLMVGLAAPPDAGATRRGMLTISPASYDFGDAVLRTPQENQMFEVSVQQGNAELVKVSITGPDAGDFKADATTGFLLPPPGAASGPTCRNSWPQPTQGTPLPGAPPPPPARPKNECEVWVPSLRLSS